MIDPVNCIILPTIVVFNNDVPIFDYYIIINVISN